MLLTPELKIGFGDYDSVLHVTSRVYYEYHTKKYHRRVMHPKIDSFNGEMF